MSHGTIKAISYRVARMPLRVSTLITPEYLVGRRFEFKGEPDVTFTGWDPAKGMRMQSLDKRRAWVPLALVREAIDAGIFVESATGAPFVWDRNGRAS
jgi:hypothetical protein